MIGRRACIVALLFVAGCSSDASVNASTSTLGPAPTTTAAASTTTIDQPSSTTMPATTEAPTTTTTGAPLPVEPGAGRLVADDFAILDGKRVGLIAHQSSVVGDAHTADLLMAATNVELVALFGPEHGIRGIADAGEAVESSTDPSTGVPVFSLYGSTRSPTPDMLEGIDVLVYDLQDVGTRYYTYISTMGLAMQAAAANDIEFVVLERPNPLGSRVGGGVLEDARTSFVGQYPIPAVYGLTSMELAQLLVDEQLLDGLDTLTYTGVPAIGLDRSTTWAETGLVWIPPSPAITSPQTALLYPATIYFEATSMSYGRGTEIPFEVVGAPWLDAEALVGELRGREVPGVQVDATTIVPRMLPNMTVTPAYLDQEIPAVRLRVTDPEAFRPTEFGVHLLDAVFTQARSVGVDPLSRPDWLDQLSGSTLLRNGIGVLSPDEIIAEHARQRAEMFARFPSYPSNE